MIREAALRIVVAGGHSAGHIEPAMNLADAVRRLAPTAEITALGTVRGLDTTLIPARGYQLELIPPVPFSRKLDINLFQTPTRLLDSIRVAGAVLDQSGAEIVVGFGGYVALPAYVAARRRRLPIVVHEANARPGLANRVAARMTSHVFTATSRVRLPHAIPLGIPMRPSITGLDRRALRSAARRRFGLRGDGVVLLVTGGSQGAGTINAAVSGAVAALRAADIQVLHITGSRHTVQIPAGRPSDPPYVVVDYMDEMRYAYAAADFTVCRSGAMTCAELSAVGMPATYVPLPQRGGEQALNAEPIVAGGGALLVDDSEFDPAWIETNLIPVLTNPEQIAAMSAHASATGAPDADTALARYVLATVTRERRHRRRAL
ncbi:UDP-N-acetylglucosamine--N-acetylmuramyl-(pentapeptide) pyrophosphoryl-undecaprenol N-acetylglucosamine transferase [Gordonia sp. HY002]|nr:UDP-N-acetylglucosamine--N-acetylmuramyl-(pentapeptide) pyrophosphoryl-undecaprenol N-acetylglucosamine transferase [Gordonia zhenghanii]MCF8570480.1 UDP-N-acetylglucosamine--N-acetylmuramyl-(pentapeptide) pyrophosphoryl-undecaprenol N-acetylglucosamine transferase [Gordonia zhenghanii]MCF8602563.1 UDP-N-acetylglucosamine--N-acetylmuramyl-(pentapeptide) pyrophosphoryl-undecaprenol N-acetylglucosamine transferase [Gordonia zhenghanii]